MTVVWLSPGLPANREELAAALPAEFVLADPHDSASDFNALAVGSLCVATVFETDLLARLAARPEGVRLLVVHPNDFQGVAIQPGDRAPEMVTAASSISELSGAIQRAASPFVTAPLYAVAAAASAPLDGTDSGEAVAAGETAKPGRGPWRGRLVTAGAVLGGLAIGGIVIASTEGSSAATATGGRAGFGAGAFPGGVTSGGAGAQGQTGIPGVTAANAQDLLACIRKAGFSGTVAQLLQNRSDPQLQQAFLSCVQQLRGGGATTSSLTTGRP